MTQSKMLIVGAYGQLGRALSKVFPEAEQADRDTLDISASSVFEAKDWSQYAIILNAAAYTAVDRAETEQGRRDAWKANATAVRNLVKIANDHEITLVHISSDYVFDGTNDTHTEDEDLSPLGVYAQTKAAGDIAVSLARKHYLIRSSWVIGDGKNFVRTMKELAEKGVKPSVVNDQIGRLTFTGTLAGGIQHLIDTNAEFGTYNLSNAGEPASWAAIAAEVFSLCGHDSSDVTGISTAEYYEGKIGIAPRPLQSTLSLDKITSTSFTPEDWRDALRAYIEQDQVSEV